MDINLLLLVLSIMTFSETTYLVYVNSKKNRIHSSDRMIFVDTSVLIDGRILTIAKAGFIGGRLCIPRSVVGELQYMADQSDSEKRSRARHGLDVINELKLIDGINFEIVDTKHQDKFDLFGSINTDNYENQEFILKSATALIR